jgi:hypothetical protein
MSNDVNEKEVVEGIRQVMDALSQHPNVVNVKIEKAKALALVGEVRRLRELHALPLPNQSPHELLGTFARQSGAANAALVRFLYSMATQLQAVTEIVLELRDATQGAQKEGAGNAGKAEAGQAREVPAGSEREPRGEEAGDPARIEVPH